MRVLVRQEQLRLAIEINLSERERAVIWTWPEWDDLKTERANIAAWLIEVIERALQELR